MALPADIISLLNHMETCGIRAFVVGGAVRDILMGRVPEDYDIAAECNPEELKAAFGGWKSFDTGIRFGTLNVFSTERCVEITCCRREGGYSDMRRPDSVEFCENIEEDLKRRDFTVNAIAMDKNGKITDPFSGVDDIKKGIIRAVGDPDVRFCEDALRIMRAVRFASGLGFEIENETKKSVLKNCNLLLEVSGERLFAELKKLLVGDNVLSVLMEYSAVICTVIPELLPSVGFGQNNPYHVYDVYEHTARAVAACPKDINIRLCMLFHDIAKPAVYTVDEKGVGHFYGHPERSAKMTEDILRRLKADGETVREVSFLIKYHDDRPSPTRKSIGKYLSKTGYKGARDLLSVRRADISAQSPEFSDRYEYILESERIINELEREGACVKISDLAVNGNDLICAGVPAGREVGKMLSYLLEKVVCEELENDKEALLYRVRRKLGGK